MGHHGGINADRAGGDACICQTERFQNILAHRAARLGTEPAHARRRVVACKRGEVYALDGADEPRRLIFLFTERRALIVAARRSEALRLTDTSSNHSGERCPVIAGRASVISLSVRGFNYVQVRSGTFGRRGVIAAERFEFFLAGIGFLRARPGDGMGRIKSGLAKRGFHIAGPGVEAGKGADKSVARAGRVFWCDLDRGILTISLAVIMRAPRPPSVTMTVRMPRAISERAAVTISSSVPVGRPERIASSLSFGTRKVTCRISSGSRSAAAGAGFKMVSMPFSAAKAMVW